MTKSTKIDTAAAARISSATAKAGNGSIPKGSFAAKAQSAAATNATRALAKHSVKSN